MDGATALFVLLGAVLAGVAYMIYAGLNARRQPPAPRPYDPLEDAKAFRKTRTDFQALPTRAAAFGLVHRADEDTRAPAPNVAPQEQPTRPHPEAPPAPAYYVERVIPGGGATGGWILLVLHNVVCLFAMMGVQTVWAQILSGVIQLNGNVVILLMLILGRRSVFVASAGQPPTDAR